MRGERDSRDRLEDMLLDAQEKPFSNPFVSCLLSTAIARYYATAGDTAGYILTIEGPWNSGIGFEFIRKRLGFNGGPFITLQEYGLPERLQPPFELVRVDRVQPWQPVPEAQVFP